MMKTKTILLFFAVFVLFSLVSAQNRKLADGSKFPDWERPLVFTKTYYVDIHSPKADDRGPGTLERPFKTINRAAQILKPGERVVISEGIYRESIHPVTGGTGPDKIISYEAAEGAEVIVKGSVELKEGWKKSEGWVIGASQHPAEDPQIWEINLDGSLFNGYNPFGMVNVLHTRYWLNYKEIEMSPFFRKRGLVFVDGRPLEQVELYRELTSTKGQSLSAYSQAFWEPIYKEMTGYAGKCWIEHHGKTLHIRLADDDSPENHTVEITVKEQVFMPQARHLGFIRIKGITFEHAGNGFPVPQRGLVSVNRGHHWIIEDNILQWANSVALDIGKEDWGAVTPDICGHHIIRNNIIRYTGICGIAGPNVENTLVENNLLEWIGWQDAQRAWESAGIKLHFAKNVLFRGNVIRHLRYAAGLWLDVANENCRITGNLFSDITTISAAIQIEASHFTNQIDHNLVWGVDEAHPGETDVGNSGVGIFIQGTDKTLIHNNLVADCFGSGLYVAAIEDRLIGTRGGTARQNRVIDNIFYNCRRAAVEFAHPNNSAEGNFYGSMHGGFLRINNPQPKQLLDLKAWQEFHGWDKKGGMARMSGEFDADHLILTCSFEPEGKLKRKIGPFKNMMKGIHEQNVDPRRIPYQELF